tara:strand:- start:284 stop:457 length:174 start_codon:yes stop_codon:yes gene_type:complete
MSLDGWSLDRKIEKVQQEIGEEIRELKMNFALLYEYIKNMEEKSTPETKARKKKAKN